MHQTDHPHETALHALTTLVRAPTFLLSATSGQLRPGGVHGLYRHDRRLLSTLTVDLCGVEPVVIGCRTDDPDRAVHRAVVGSPSHVSDNAPKTHLTTTRQVTGDGLIDTLELVNTSVEPVALRLRLRAATDLAEMGAVRGGARTALVRPEGRDGGISWRDNDSELLLSSDPQPSEFAVDADGAVICWDLLVSKDRSATLRIGVRLDERPGSEFRPERPATPPRWEHPELNTTDHRQDRLLRRSLDDLDRLLLADPDDNDAAFLAAGTPWYCTLFGRDAIWSARLLLPHNPDLAHGTLRALAARQGSRYDPLTEEEPGKILHEVRRNGVTTPGSLALPPLYYGTVDATALWVCLLHEAWRAGLADPAVRALLPNLRRALEWIMGPADQDGDGFLEYLGSSRGGLVNQGWKDSGDSVQWCDGTVAAAPIALSEVQGYAHEAVLGGANLLDAFDLPGASRCRQWAAELRDRFRARYWIDDEFGRYPAIALDGRKQPVTGAASNMGHLLGTGLLDPDETASVAARLGRPDLDSPHGLRTLSDAHAGFDPVSYHCGSVWPHDNAIVLLGLAAQGHHDLARALAGQLISVAESFDYRLPELYGSPIGRADTPVAAYPSSCAPQAWSAAAGMTAIGYLNGWTHTLHPAVRAARS